jgi:Ca2+-binding RTX toxin-like protein
VEVFINSQSQGKFTVDGTIYVFGHDGNDGIVVSPKIPLSAVVDGGAGNDTIWGGVNDILIGGDGRDVLHGRAGRNILIGGTGGDHISAGHGGNILVGGATAYDSDYAALEDVLAEWSSTHTFAERTSNILGAGSGPSENGSVFFIPSGTDSTVSDDAVRDVLTTGSKMDWVFAQTVGKTRDRV